MLLSILAIVGAVYGYFIHRLAIWSLRGREYQERAAAVWVSSIGMALLLPLLYSIQPGYFPLHAVVAGLLFWILLTDWMAMLILNQTLLICLLPIMVLRLLYPLPGGIVDSLLGLAGGFIIMLVLGIASRGKIGGGDIKLYALLGFVFGWSGILSNLFLASVLALGGTLVFMALRRRTAAASIAFGPYIALSSCLLLLLPA